jgi:hypothetical protein
VHKRQADQHASREHLDVQCRLALQKVSCDAPQTRGYGDKNYRQNPQVQHLCLKCLLYSCICEQKHKNQFLGPTGAMPISVPSGHYTTRGSSCASED